MNKPRPHARPLADVAAALLNDSFRKQGFASKELVTSWPEIIGADVAICAEPVKIQWPRGLEGDAQQPGTLVLRVEGPAAIEIQHLSGVILERVNRFFGWQAVSRLAIRQAPVSARRKKERRNIDPEKARNIEKTLGIIEDDDLRRALGRLGAAIKRS
ncbi:MAG: DciA family protein [Pseudorhodoplanes sp.]|nr:DciA family protein [Pseudorhodoplanes sp.]